MGNVAVAGKLAGSDRLDALCRLALSVTEPEDDQDDDGEEGGDEGEQDGEGGTGIKPEGMPHE